MRPLDGIRVVDFGWVAVGPVLSSLLAEFGAEVIKVESSRRLDYCRLIPTPLGEDEKVSDALASRAHEIDTVLLFHQYNRGKLGITVDLRHPGAPELLKRLVARSDVVVENFSPSVLREVGLDYPALARVKPDLIMISCSAVGHGGPWEAVRTFAPSLSSLAGLERLIGYPGERCLGALTFGYADPSNAHHGLFAVLAALWHREKTGEGQWIDMSQLEATVGLAGEALMDYFMNRRVWKTQGATHASLAPHGIYPCRGEDEWVALACQTEAEWRAFCQVVGDPAWCGEPRFGDLDRRKKNGDALDARITEWTRAVDCAEIVSRCQALGLPAAPVLGLEAHDAHPYFRARGTLASVTHPVVGSLRLYASPIKLAETPGWIDRPAPCLGEDNPRIFGELLGLAPDEIEQLRADGLLR
ncbi:MAG: CoA transferase [Candidatus Rokubacteria bacterium]|nr:CoA transferase [Candidatus Rokubacteria bacterium]